MVESTNKPIVLAMGTAGTGKSTMLNRLLGNDEGFGTSGAAQSCTQSFTGIQTDYCTILDTPGLGDLNMTLEMWAAKLNSSVYKDQKVALALLVIKASIRP